MYNRRMTASPLTRVLLLGLVAALAAGGCRAREVENDLRITDVQTGWYDAGIVNGQNKLVPSISFKLRNTSDQQLIMLQVNALFRRVNETDEWGSGFLTVAGSEGLAPGASTDALLLNSHLGYTGTEPRNEMLENSQFIDAKVELFAKYGSRQWQPVGEHPIERRLIKQ